MLRVSAGSSSYIIHSWRPKETGWSMSLGWVCSSTFQIKTRTTVSLIAWRTNSSENTSGCCLLPWCPSSIKTLWYLWKEEIKSLLCCCKSFWSESYLWLWAGAGFTVFNVIIRVVYRGVHPFGTAANLWASLRLIKLGWRGAQISQPLAFKLSAVEGAKHDGRL